jgi:hypothetical protein
MRRGKSCLQKYWTRATGSKRANLIPDVSSETTRSGHQRSPHRSERKTPSKEALQSGAFKGIPSALLSERKSNGLRIVVSLS